MDSFTVFPDPDIGTAGLISQQFRKLGIASFQAACAYVRDLPYGYNSNRDDILILFKERFGSCTTKHAAIATLAGELALPIAKHIGIYAMTEELVSGTSAILNKHALPYLPMIHCFLAYKGFRVDLTEGSANGKNSPINEMLFAQPVDPDIAAKEEYLLYRNALKNDILNRMEFKGVELKTILLAREEGMALLRANLD